MAQLSAAITPRDVTEAEVAFYRENGWVKLDRLIPPEEAGDLLERAQRLMGAHAEAQSRTRSEGIHKRPDHVVAMWRNHELPSEDDELYRELALSPQIGRIADRFLGGRGARFWKDEVLVKMPATEAGASTPWHQDFPYMPHDRGGIMQFWIALVDCPPERGSLRFLTRSREAGPMGRVVAQAGGDVVDQYPELAERYPESPPLDLKAGDATVHDYLTVHAAGVNTTDVPRWAHTIGVFPADVFYTGAPQRYADDVELELNKPFDHPRFPLIAPPSR
jgi:ectoine hydroxylase-related dioxygenase (phytanoyl-CoA dioxygenase family)